MVDRIGRVTLTNPDKVLYPATGTTKAEVFDYYINVAEVMIPHIAGRAVTRKRWPNGVDEPSFFEKQLASSAPDWLDTGRGLDELQLIGARKPVGHSIPKGRSEPRAPCDVITVAGPQPDDELGFHAAEKR